MTAFAIAAGMFAMFLYLTLYIQTLLNLSPLQTGIRFLPFTIVSFFAAAITGRVSHRFPARALLFVGLMLTGLGIILMRAVTPTSSWTVFVPGFVIAGAGIGIVNPVLAFAAIGVVTPQRSGMATGINNTFRQVGTATGIAALGAIFQSTLTRHLDHSARGYPGRRTRGEISRAVTAGGAQQVSGPFPTRCGRGRRRPSTWRSPPP